ncbi:interferon-inducible GTPase 5-like isoform X2 [Crotalus tigris]|uniref:interferon-inducible GTPase 5-like isoform X2 n=1 Tax=Crotalus tigris TaxID=88082 RepID=UPI00192F3153|nr:interferon-inducible GTPase 5-like isoform X2 [Crotalus tigris]
MGNLAVKDNLRREFEDLKSDLNQGSVPKVTAEYQQCLNEMQNLPLDIAVTGDAGVGKSSFINAFRGVMDDDNDAAEVAAVEGTKMPKPYPYPSFPNIKLWDLPGIGTPKFRAAEYMKKVQFERYDVFLIFTSDRFTENDALLAKEIKRMRKKCYYVRARIDESIFKVAYLAEMAKISAFLKQQTQEKFFAVWDKWIKFIQFRLDDRSLCFLAHQTGKEFEELKSAIKKTPLPNTINAELVFSLLMKSSVWVTVSVVEVALDVIPVLGSLFGGASSYVVTCHFLNSFLDDAVEDAQNVLAKLLE